MWSKPFKNQFLCYNFYDKVFRFLILNFYIMKFKQAIDTFNSIAKAILLILSIISLVFSLI
jgi:hypothetical protein